MTDDASADKNLIESTWAEARDLVKRLEGSSVQRLAVKAGEYEIEIERGAPAPLLAGDAGGEVAAAGPVTLSAGPGMGSAPEARAASGAFAAITETDDRVPVLAPLVGTFYASAQPGADPFVSVGDAVEAGETVCIVEAMKLMNEVAAGEGGKVAEILVENGEPVEFEQVLMYLEPAGE